MEELVIVGLGCLVTILLAAIKVLFGVVALTTFWIWFPTFCGVLIAFGVWLPDWS